MEQQKCSHEACHCAGAEARNDGYCSDACRRGEMSGGKCACGHSDCR